MVAGPVELTLTLVLQQYGLDPVSALSTTLVFRLFEFILPLLIGIWGFLTKSGNLLYRVTPPLFILTLGIVNILSVLTPPIRYRLHLLHDFLPGEVIQGSNLLVIMSGIILILLAASLFKGYRNAWYGTLFLNAVYFRIPFESIQLYQGLKKKTILIGQEAIVDISDFSLEGRERKGLRNSVNKMEKEGYFCKIYEPPVKDGLLQKLKFVSDEWLKDGKEESTFSQGIFLWDELKQHTILTAENEDEKVVAFINLIPDYAPNEGIYDLQRRLADSPNGVLEYLQIKMFEYFRSKGYHFVNLGLVPMSGLQEATHPAERTIRFLYEQLPQFSHYKGLRFYKEKCDPLWVDKYLVYTNSFDLLRIPGAINKVMKV